MFWFSKLASTYFFVVEFPCPFFCKKCFFLGPKEQEALRRYESKFNEVRDGVHAGYNRKSFPWAMPQKVLIQHSLCRDPVASVLTFL